MAGGSNLLAKRNNNYDAVKDQYSLAQRGGGWVNNIIIM